MRQIDAKSPRLTDIEGKSSKEKERSDGVSLKVSAKKVKSSGRG